MIKVYSSRAVHPNIITISNQYESQTRYLDFDLSEIPEGNRYLIVTYEKTSYAFPIGEDGRFEVTSSLTWEPAKTYYGNIVVSNIPIDDKLESSSALFVSDTMKLIVSKNYINAESLSEQPFPKEFQIVYDELLDLKREIEQKLENGEFNGKDGIGIKSIEKTGSEGLVDTYTITLTDDSTFAYTVTNGKDGIDGKSAYELAVENGFDGTEEEWLESLRYDHSDEFKQLADQVKLDAKSAADNATKAENAMNEANTTAQENVEAINQASTNAQNAITTTKGNAVQAVQSAQQTAENAIGTKQTEAVQAVDTAKTSATQEITEQKESAVSAITQERSEAIEAIETGKTEALNDIATAKDNAIEEIENTGVPLEDIEKLAIKEAAEGNPTIINDSTDWRLQSLNVYGQSSQDGTPTPETPVEIISKEISKIKVTGTNLFDAEWIKGLDDYQSQSKDIGSFSKGKYCLSVQGISENDIKKDAYFAVRIKVGETYTNTYWIIHPSSPNPKVLTGINFDIVSDFQINLYIYNDTEEQLQSVYETLSGHIQLNNNFNAKPYEPYKSQSITLSEPITLRGIPVETGGNITIDGQQYVSDVIKEKNGVIGVERNCYLKELEIADMNNSEDYPGWNKLDDIYIFAEDGKSGSLNNRLLNITTNLNTVFFNANKTSEYTNKILYLSKTLFDGKTQTEIKENYPNLTVVFVFERLEPTFEPLPDEIQAQYKALKSYYPNTVIQTGCWNEVEYVADTKLYVEKKINEVVSTVSNIQNVLIGG